MVGETWVISAVSEQEAANKKSPFTPVLNAEKWCDSNKSRQILYLDVY